MIRKKNKELGRVFMEGENKKFDVTFTAYEKGIVSAEQLAEIEKMVNNEIDRFNYSDDDFKEISIKICRVPDGQVIIKTSSFLERDL